MARLRYLPDGVNRLFGRFIGASEGVELPVGEDAARNPPRRYPLTTPGGFFPLVATNLTQWPWFLKPGKLRQPPFLH